MLQLIRKNETKQIRTKEVIKHFVYLVNKIDLVINGVTLSCDWVSQSPDHT